MATEKPPNRPNTAEALVAPHLADTLREIENLHDQIKTLERLADTLRASLSDLPNAAGTELNPVRAGQYAGMRIGTALRLTSRLGRDPEYP
jgi:hypothetical protein